MHAVDEKRKKEEREKERREKGEVWQMRERSRELKIVKDRAIIIFHKSTRNKLLSTRTRRVALRNAHALHLLDLR